MRDVWKHSIKRGSLWFMAFMTGSITIKINSTLITFIVTLASVIIFNIFYDMFTAKKIEEK